MSGPGTASVGGEAGASRGVSTVAWALIFPPEFSQHPPLLRPPAGQVGPPPVSRTGAKSKLRQLQDARVHGSSAGFLESGGRFRNGAGPFQACGREVFFPRGCLQPPSHLRQTPPGEPASRLGPRGPVGWRPCLSGSCACLPPGRLAGRQPRGAGKTDGSPEMGV